MTAADGTLSVAFHLTHNCNLRCVYCYTGAKFGSGMTEAVADCAADFALTEARQQGVGHLETIFFGGEPLMKLNLLCRIADRLQNGARRLRTSFKMSTNGTLLTAGAVEELARRRVYVSISLDGAPETQATQRPQAAGHDTAASLDEAIDRLLRWNPCANAHCVVTPTTAGQLDSSVLWLFARGFAYVSTALDYSASWTRANLNELRGAYERLAGWYFERTMSGDKLYLSCFDDRIHSRTRGPLNRSERCHIGHRQFSIAPSGRLYPCVQFVREDEDLSMALGDVFTGFDSKARAALAACSEQAKPECAGCVLADRCSSWCACVNWQSTGRVDRASPLLCEHERLLLPIADRLANQLWKRRNAVFLHKHYNPAYPALSFAERTSIAEAAHESVE
ncbi:MAG TPA: radical SAM protein [Pirellulales bacterium]|nr:radical SAM protein [Pirellulales bacterium]